MRHLHPPLTKLHHATAKATPTAPTTTTTTTSATPATSSYEIVDGANSSGKSKARKSNGNLILFDGQGIAAATSSTTFAVAAQDARDPYGKLLLDACQQALHAEYASLSPDEQHQLGLSASDLSILDIGASMDLTHPVLANVTLCTIQLLRVIAHYHALPKENNVQAIGFSSGILPAIALATSGGSLVDYLSTALHVFRLSFWVGVRTQLFRLQQLRDASLQHAEQPWSLVIVGATREEVQSRLDDFHGASVSPVWITAVTHPTCVSVSGRPDSLSAFQSSLTSFSTSTPAIYTLYHAPTLESVKGAILSDVTRRKITVPNDLSFPVKSTLDGATMSGDILEQALDLLLIQPVNLDITLQQISSYETTIWNIGPGSGLAKTVARGLRGAAKITDLSTLSGVAGGAPTPVQVPIAIVGMGVNFPGGRTADELWETLEKGLNTVTEIPLTRFDVKRYNNAPAGAKRAMKAKHGNFISDHDHFDNAFFRISPREARSMDPQHRQVLTVAYEALEDAGYVPFSTPTWNPETLGAYVGVATYDYVQNLRNAIDVYYTTGTLPCFLAGRLAYVLGLSGPVLSVDTACSSSSVSVFQACRALAAGDCNAALAGGVNMVTSPDMYLGLDRGHLLSQTGGNCRAFDASADGYTRSEGVGIFVLKRLSDAISENDRILGVIRGVEMNQSGNSHSITHPHSPTQAKLFNQCLNASGVDPRQVNLVEAHGTGTQAGDPAEVESIRSVFAAQRAADDPLYITSIKGNIGHCEAASGAAGLAKMLLMMRHRTIPAQRSLKTLNPKIPDLNRDNTKIVTQNTPWAPPSGQTKRMSMLNNFGAAGSNTSIILEEAPTIEPLRTSREEPGVVTVGLSADSAEALERLKEKYTDFLRRSDAKLSIIDFAYTSTARRQVFSHRLAVSAKSREELIENLSSASSVHVKPSESKLFMVFSGQGGQYVGMGQELFRTSPLFRGIVHSMHDRLVSWGFPGVLQVIDRKVGEKSGLSGDEEFQAFQAAIFVIGYGMAMLWKSWGVLPDAVAGHSLGEYAALAVAGVLEPEDALHLVAYRVRLFVEKCEANVSGMMAVRLGSRDAENAFKAIPLGSQLSVACHNSRTDCTISGPVAALDQLKAHLAAEGGVKAIKLEAPYAFHTSSMDGVAAELSAFAEQFIMSPPSIYVVSIVHGKVVQPGDPLSFTHTYFARHCAGPVLFEQGVRDLSELPEFAEIRAVIDVGPHPTTLPMLQFLASPPRSTKLIPTIRRKVSVWETFGAALATLYTQFSPILWRAVYSELFPNARCVSLPFYPWAGTKYWVPFEEEEPAVMTVGLPASSETLPYALLGATREVPSTSSPKASFTTPLESLSKFLDGHRVAEYPLCPASVYHELALAGAEVAMAQLGIESGGFDLSDIVYKHPLIREADTPHTVITVVNFSQGTGTFAIQSFANAQPDRVQTHCEGLFLQRKQTNDTAKLRRKKLSIEKQSQLVLAGYGDETPETYYRRTIYDVIFSRVVGYSSEYHALKTLTLSKTGMDAVAVMKLPSSFDTRSFVFHPIMMDGILQAAGFVANMLTTSDQPFICNEVKSVKMSEGPYDPSLEYRVYSTVTLADEEGLAYGDAYVTHRDKPHIVASIKGMLFRKLRLSSLARAFSHASSSSTHQPTKRSVTAIVKPHQQTVPAITRIARPTPVHLVPSAPISRDDLLAKTIEIVSETSGLAPSAVSANSSLADIGVDSLMAIEIAAKLKTLLPGLEILPGKLHALPSIADIVSLVSPASPSTARMKTEVAVATSSSAVSVESLTKGALVAVLASSLSISPTELKSDVDFHDLGLDSLTSIEALSSLRPLVAIQTLPDNLFTLYPTVNKLFAFLQAASQAPVKVNTTTSVQSVTQSTEVVVDPSNAFTPDDARRLLANVLDLPQQKLLDESVNFDDLGLDSLTSIEALGALRNAVGDHLPENLFTQCRTLDQLLSVLFPNSSRSSASPLPDITPLLKTLRMDEPIVQFQRGTDPTKLPIFLFHDGSGMAHYYGRLANLGRSMFAISNPKYITGEAWQNGIYAMVEAYKHLVLPRAGQGCLVGGWSFGGVIAFEMARQLRAAGIRVPGVVLIDSPPPTTQIPLPDSLVAASIPVTGTGARAQISLLARRSMKNSGQALVDYDPRRSPAASSVMPSCVFIRSKETFFIEGSDFASFVTDREGDPRKTVAGWDETLGKPVPMLHIPGHHFQVFEPHIISSVSERVVEAISMLESP